MQVIQGLRSRIGSKLYDGVSIFLVLVFCALFTPSPALADVGVSPVAVFMGDETRTARVSIENSGSTPRLVEVGFVFGYPVSDEEGNLTFKFFDTVQSTEPSATEWVSVYPEKFVLPAGSAQVVVVVAKPPVDLPVGEYWARPVFTILPIQQSSDSTDDPDLVRPTQDPTQKIVLSLNYRHGSMSTAVTVEGLSAKGKNGAVEFLVDLQRTGNAAFLGNMVCRVRNKKDEIVAEVKQEIAVYHSLTRKVNVSISGMPDEDYVAEVELNCQRMNGRDQILHSATVTRVAKIQLSSAYYQKPGKGEEPSGKSNASLEKTIASNSIPIRPFGVDIAGSTGNEVHSNPVQRSQSSNKVTTPSTDVATRVVELERVLKEVMANQVQLVSALNALRAK